MISNGDFTISIDEWHDATNGGPVELPSDIDFSALNTIRFSSELLKGFLPPIFTPKEITEARPESTMTTKVAKVKYPGSGSYFNALPGESGLSSWARVYSGEDELYRFYRKCDFFDPDFQFSRPHRKLKCMDADGYMTDE